MVADPSLPRHVVPVRGRLVKGVFCRTKDGVLRSDEVPGICRQPSSLGTHHSISFRLLTFFEALEFFNPFAFQVAFSGFCVDRCRRETMLNGEGIRHDTLEDWILQQFWINRRAGFGIHESTVSLFSGFRNLLVLPLGFPSPRSGNRTRNESVFFRLHRHSRRVAINLPWLFISCGTACWSKNHLIQIKGPHPDKTGAAW